MYPHFDQRRTRTLAALAGVSAVSLSLSAHAAAAPHSPRTTTSIVAPLTTVVPPFAVGPAHSVGVHPSNPLNFTVTSKHVFGTNITHADVLRSAEAAQADHDHALISEMIAAGNSIATLPYIWGGGHGTWVSPGYDCSGSVSFVLHAAGLLSTPEDSSQLMSYGVPGPGK
jgi:cell wall-associated NlpC family hydrolase